MTKNRKPEEKFDPPPDKGIAAAVAVLRREGVETFESCEGGPGHSYPEPTIRFHGDPAEGPRALSVAMRAGLPVASVRRVWTVQDKEPVGPVWEIVFVTKPAQKRAKVSAGAKSEKNDKCAAKTYQFALDGLLFRAQRETLIQLMEEAPRGSMLRRNLSGLVNLTDTIADQAHDEHGIDCLIPYVPASDDRGKTVCACRLPGFWCSGIPGILAHVVHGEVAAETRVERCDTCARYPTDAAAAAVLRKLGMLKGDYTTSPGRRRATRR